MLLYAIELCRDYHAELEIIHVVEQSIHPAFFGTGKSSIFDFLPDVYEKSSSLIKEMYDAISGPKPKMETKITEGVAAQEILKHIESNNIDLIVLSTHGTSGLNQFLLGGVAEKIIRRSTRPVFTIKSFGRELI
jgi:nucleotide-binding universal stress UspA family protein